MLAKIKENYENEASYSFCENILMAYEFGTYLQKIFVVSERFANEFSPNENIYFVKFFTNICVVLAKIE